jgi:hypothetical protein
MDDSELQTLLLETERVENARLREELAAALSQLSSARAAAATAAAAAAAASPDLLRALALNERLRGEVARLRGELDLRPPAGGCGGGTPLEAALATHAQERGRWEATKQSLRGAVEAALAEGREVGAALAAAEARAAAAEARAAAAEARAAEGARAAAAAEGARAAAPPPPPVPPPPLPPFAPAAGEDVAEAALRRALEMRARAAALLGGGGK